MKHFIIILLTILSIELSGQVVRIYALVDSAKLGSVVEIALTSSQLSTDQILFPDSNYNYFPFQYVDKIFFNTISNDSISNDSVIYYLRTFEIDSMISISLPIYNIDRFDTIKLYSDTIKIPMKLFYNNEKIVGDVIAMDQIKYPKADINYLKIISYVLIIFVLIYLFYRFFGAVIIRNYKVYTMYKKHLVFIKQFEFLQNNFQKHQSVDNIEKIIAYWKDYLTTLDHFPINTYTTTEISSLYKNEYLAKSLQLIDQSIYGGRLGDDTSLAIENLHDFTNKRYKLQRELLRNGQR